MLLKGLTKDTALGQKIVGDMVEKQQRKINKTNGRKSTKFDLDSKEGWAGLKAFGKSWKKK